MRTLLVVTSALAGRLALADVATPAPAAALDLSHADADDAQFRRWVKRRNAKNRHHLSSWGWAQLDDDAAPERFAFVCTEEDYEGGMLLLLEDAPGHRWVITRDTDGRNNCDVDDKAPWQRESPPTAIALHDNYHGGSDGIRVALRGGRPVVVGMSCSLHHYHVDEDGSEDDVDFDALERSLAYFRFDRAKDEVVPAGSERAALVRLGGAAGRYRQRTGSGDVPGFEVTVKPAPVGRRHQVTVRLARPARAGEAIEVWTVGASGKALGWAATWDGARWQLAGRGRAPRELPPVTGDAASVTVPIVPHGSDDANGNPVLLAPLAVVAVSADGATRLATGDVDDGQPSLVGGVVGDYGDADAKAE